MQWLLKNRGRRADPVLDKFFEDFGLAPITDDGWNLASFTPKVNVAETDKEVKISAELPGMDEKEIEVSVSDGYLTIKGEKKEEREEKEKNYYRMERSTGYFHRDIPFPCEVDADKSSAVFKKGVLTVTLPKTQKAKGRQIEVKPE